MKKTLLFTCSAILYCAAATQTQAAASASGIYQQLILGIDPANGAVTGYYSEIDEPPNRPRSECSFFLSGKSQGDHYAIQAWQPGKAKSGATGGELQIFSGGKDGSSVRLKLDKLSRDCTALNPKLGKAEGALLDKNKDGAWTEVRMVGNSKSSYYQSPDIASPERGSARKGSVLTVTGRQRDWAQVQANQKPRGWVQESDFYPTSPDAAMPKSAKPSKPVAAAAPKPEVTTKPTPAQEPKIESAAAPANRVKVDIKAGVLQRLKTLNSQAFDLARRVVANPAERSTLAVTASLLEKDLNAAVESLNQADPALYRGESMRIYETYLDLQFVRQPQAVVSLRLRQEILK